MTGINVRWGDPLIDLGLLLNYWTEATDTPERQFISQAPTSLSGFYTRAELVQRYAEKSGRDVSGIAFYETFALWKTAIVCLQLFVLYTNGQLQDERLSDFDLRAQRLVETAHSVLNHQQCKIGKEFRDKLRKNFDKEASA